MELCQEAFVSPRFPTKSEPMEANWVLIRSELHVPDKAVQNQRVNSPHTALDTDTATGDQPNDGSCAMPLNPLCQQISFKTHI